MKTKTFLVTILFLSVLSTNAQRFKGGILAGINASQIDGDSWAGYHKTGALLGAFVNTDITNKMGWQLEIKYSGKGSATHPKWPLIEKVRLNYIDIPVLFIYKPNSVLKLEGGASINYLFKAQYYDGDWFDNWVKEPNKIESAIVLGLNYTFFQSFDVNIKYSYSLLPVRTQYSTSSFVEGAWFNNLFSFALYFNLTNKKS